MGGTVGITAGQVIFINVSPSSVVAVNERAGAVATTDFAKENQEDNGCAAEGHTVGSE